MTTGTLTRAQWLEHRRKYIGGSDAAAAIGLSRFKTPLQVWQEKLGKADDSPTEAMIRGQMLEPLVRDAYEETTGHEISAAAWVISKQVPFMAATPDAIDDTINSLVQIKTADAWGRHSWGPDGSSQVPDDYMIQAQHEMAVIGAKRNRFAVLFADSEMFRALVWMLRGGVAQAVCDDFIRDQIQNEKSRCEFCVYPIERDDDLIATIVEGEKIFWTKYIEAEVVPPDPSIPETKPDFIKADKSQREWIEKLRDAYEKYDEADERYDQIKAVIVSEIGENAGMIADGLAKIHYKAPEKKEKTDWQTIAEAMRMSAPGKFALLFKQHTEMVQGSRTFRVYWK